jgi:hypothetical protein
MNFKAVKNSNSSSFLGVPALFCYSFVNESCFLSILPGLRAWCFILSVPFCVCIALHAYAYVVRFQTGLYIPFSEIVMNILIIIGLLDPAALVNETILKAKAVQDEARIINLYSSSRATS